MVPVIGRLPYHQPARPVQQALQALLDQPVLLAQLTGILALPDPQALRAFRAILALLALPAPLMAIPGQRVPQVQQVTSALLVQPGQPAPLTATRALPELRARPGLTALMVRLALQAQPVLLGRRALPEKQALLALLERLEPLDPLEQQAQ